ncbi:MAG: shikimate kinase [Pyrinomonadaceae bacterium]|jgi:shikimate kinase|nr:shikimate kinase [Pyrinomonadaceae bacterium]
MEDALIVVTGFMGSGKSTVARALALRLDSQMVDLDEEILKQEGRSAKHLIEEQGEPAFREIETRVLRDVLHNNAAGVIALGGGAWTMPGNRDLIVSTGCKSVWLDAPFSLCWKRIVAGILDGKDGRPLARNEQEALTLYAERRAAYASADLHLEVTGYKTADDLALEIVKALLEC